MPARRLLSLAVPALLAVLSGVLLVAPAYADQPQIILDQTTVAVGDRLLVRLSGWPAGLVNVELCGNAARNGSVDCGLDRAVQRFVPASGAATVTLRLAAPPVSCPCVVRATAIDGGARATAPLILTGMVDSGEASAATAAALPALAITGLRAQPRRDAGLAGWSTTVDVTVTLHNNGPGAVMEPIASVTVGRGDRPTGFVAVAPIGPIAPGDSRTVSIPVVIPGPTYGQYTIRGEVGWPVAAHPVIFEANIRTYPWGLAALAALILVANIVLALRAGRVRRGGERGR